MCFKYLAAPDAFAKVVERLLASPRYGERWGRYWLDVARYADTKGYVFEEERKYPYSYTYRDWVIRALNEDLPYDQFLTQQIAADLLPLGDDKRALAALGFLTLGRRFLNNQPDIIDDRIDVVCRAPPQGFDFTDLAGHMFFTVTNNNLKICRTGKGPDTVKDLGEIGVHEVGNDNADKK